MQPLRRSELQPPAATLPTWAVWAVAPLVIALGIISGMAAATYLGGGLAAAPTQVPQANQTSSPPASEAGATTPKPANTTNPAPNTAVTGSIDIPAANQTAPTPVTVSGTAPTTAPAEVKDLRDAKAVLDESFSLFSDGGVTINSIQYQLMTNTGYSKSLVGMISVRDHESWVKVLAENPKRLEAWLESAVARVRPALEKELVFLSWAVVEVRWDRPPGFSNSEVKQLSDGSYLITRPLAAAIDPSQTMISLRPAGALPAAGTGPAGPWAMYGPQIRFDSSDMYRPLGRDGKPIR